MTSTKPTIWVYDLPSVAGEGWGTFILRSDGYFSCVTDYGNYAFRWLRHGEDDFRAFWLKDRWNFPSYVVSKLTNHGYTMTTRTREASERQCTMFCKAMLPRLAEAIRAEMGNEESKP